MTSVIAVGERVFTTAIWSQENPKTEIDWRQGIRPGLRHENFLPEPVQRQRVGPRSGAISSVYLRRRGSWRLAWFVR